MDSPWLVVGLGNPGKEYERTRHNAGVRSIERLAEVLGAKLRPSKTPALVGDAMREGVRILLARPTTYMNESGQAIASLLRWFKIDPQRLIVLHDEIDLPLAALRLKRGGGTAGHHGLDSIVSALGSEDFYRVRIGVGRTKVPETPDRVLGKVRGKEAEQLAMTETDAAEAVLAVIFDGIERAMNRFNTSDRAQPSD